MAYTYYCRPSDIVTDSATLTLTAGSANASFPLSNAKDRKAHTVFKSTGTGCTIRATFGSPQALQAVAIINHKLAGATVTLTNGAGLNQSIAIPANTSDGHCIDPWKSLIGVANATSTIWDIAITGAATVCAVGEILLVASLREIEILLGAKDEEGHPAIVHATDYGVLNRYGMGVRQRRLVGTVLIDTLRADVLALQRDARGALKAFLLVVDSDVNDALYVDLALNARTFSLDVPGATPVDLEFLEQQKGLAL